MSDNSIKNTSSRNYDTQSADSKIQEQWIASEQKAKEESAPLKKETFSDTFVRVIVGHRDYVTYNGKKYKTIGEPISFFPFGAGAPLKVLSQTSKIPKIIRVGTAGRLSTAVAMKRSNNAAKVVKAINAATLEFELASTYKTKINALITKIMLSVTDTSPNLKRETLVEAFTQYGLTNIEAKSLATSVKRAIGFKPLLKANDKAFANYVINRGLTAYEIAKDSKVPFTGLLDTIGDFKKYDAALKKCIDAIKTRIK